MLHCRLSIDKMVPKPPFFSNLPYVTMHKTHLLRWLVANFISPFWFEEADFPHEISFLKFLSFLLSLFFLFSFWGTILGINCFEAHKKVTAPLEIHTFKFLESLPNEAFLLWGKSIPDWRGRDDKQKGNVIHLLVLFFFFFFLFFPPCISAEENTQNSCNACNHGLPSLWLWPENASTNWIFNQIFTRIKTTYIHSNVKHALWVAHTYRTPPACPSRTTLSNPSSTREVILTTI